MEHTAFVIGDTHGGFDLFTKAMARIKRYVVENSLSIDDYVIVTLGDYIDRGENARGIIDYLIKHPEIKAIKGNHEQMLLDCFSMVDYTPRDESLNKPQMHFWMTNGGVATLESYNCNFGPEDWLDCIPKAHVKWLSELPSFYETKHHYFVHAGCNQKFDLANQLDKDRLWIRSAFLNYDYDFGKHIVHGHSPMQDFMPEYLQFRTNLDTGSVWSGRQVIGVFDLDENEGPFDTLYVKDKT